MFRERVAAHISRWTPAPVGVYLFGSAARGDGRRDSDVDLLVVRPDDVAPDDPVWSAHVADLERSVTAWTGNPGQVVEHGAAELRRAAAEREPLIDALRAEAVTVAGASIVDLTRTVPSLR